MAEPVHIVEPNIYSLKCCSKNVKVAKSFFQVVRQPETATPSYCSKLQVLTGVKWIVLQFPSGILPSTFLTVSLLAASMSVHGWTARIASVLAVMEVSCN